MKFFRLSLCDRFALLLFILSALWEAAVFAQELTHGPFAGGVTSSSARFYLRAIPPGAANIQISLQPDFSARFLGRPVTTDSSRDFAALVRIENLMSNQLYYYQALINGQPAGEVRRFKTFPPEGERPHFHFAFGSCIGNRAQPSPDFGRVFEVMAQDEPRFFLQIGDWGYPDNTDTPQNPSNVFSADLARVQASYRTKYDTSYALQKLLRVAPIDYVYDDHDYMNDNASATSYPRADSFKTIAVSPNPRANSARAYQELFPGYALANGQGGIWHKFTFGNAAFFMLDTRSRRSDDFGAFRRNAATDSIEFAPPPTHSILAGDAALADENQMDWLLRELKASTADWKFLVSSVPFNQSLRGLIDLSVSLQDSMVFLPGLGTQSLLRVALELCDKWAGFPADQERLLQFLKTNGIRNVIVLTGDSHTSAIDDGKNSGLPELMAGALDQANSRFVLILRLFGYDIWNAGGQTESFNDAYGRVAIFGEDSVRLEIVDEFSARIASHTILNQNRTSVRDQEKTALPARFRLSPNFPNPWQPQTHGATTAIRYELQHRAYVNVFVYDLLGRRVRTFQTVLREAGRHAQAWEGRNDRGEFAAAGVYLLRVQFIDLQGRETWASQKLALVR